MRLIWWTFSLALVGCLPTGGGDGGSSGGSGGGGATDAAVDQAVCVPACVDRQCGDDGCGDQCGACLLNTTCNVAGICVSSADCGDGTCGDDEDCATCEADCGACCGNGVCDGSQGEHCGTCAEDCLCAESEICDEQVRGCVEIAQGGGGGGGGAGGGTGGTAGGGGAGGTAGGGAGGAGPGAAPEIVALGPTGRLTEDEELLIIAQVNDPDAGDVLRGSLRLLGGGELGEFVALDQPGAFTVILTWQALQAATLIEFDQGGQQPQTVEAVFTDQAGHQARRALELTLHCEAIGACDGACVDRRSVGHCGACDSRCDGAAGEQCSAAGVCTCPGVELRCGASCVNPNTDADHCGGCNQGCPNTEPTCQGGQCVCVGACLVPEQGELVITEVMSNPDAVADSRGEWVEIWNATQRVIDLEGYHIGGDANHSDFTIEESLPVAPGGFVVIGRRVDPGENGGVPVDYEARGLSLRNADDGVFLTDTLFDVVDWVMYGGDWPLAAGQSMQLDAALNWRNQRNTDEAGWCVGEAAWPGSAGDLGTPGAPNIACP